MGKYRVYHKAVSLLCALTAIFLLLTACHTKEQAAPADAVAAMCAAEKPLPSGRVYSLSATKDSDEYLSDTLLATTFGNGSLPPAMDGVSDAACFFSYTQPCEFAVFLCKSTDSTDAVAKMCLQRLDTLKHERANEASYLENACVTVRGRWVVLCISSDTDAALRAFRRVV